MEMLDYIKSRRSIRKYSDKPLKEEDIKKICEAGSWAASAKGLQSPLIVAITNKELITKLSKMNAAIMDASFDPFFGAPCVIIVFADTNIGTYIYDGSLVMGNMMLEAHSLGLGSCWIHRAKQMFESEEGKELLKEFNIPEYYEGIANLIVGYPLEERIGKERKDNYFRYIK